MMGVSRRRFLANSALLALYGAASRPASAASASLPWRNWSGGQVAYPAGRIEPATETELIDFLASSQGPIRPVGSGHSFTGLVPTDGQLIVIDRLNGLLDYDSDTLEATFAAGARLGDTGSALEAVGQAMFNLPDIDRQTLAGATATATHGTGLEFFNLSGYITGLRLVTSTGSVLDLDAEHQPDVFDAARVSLGALGIVTRIRMRNRTPYRLKQRSWIMPIDEVMEQFEDLAGSHRHFEIFPLTHSDYAIALATDETTDAINNPEPSPEEAAAFDEAMASFAQVPPEQRKPLVNGLAQQIEPSERVDVSYRVLTNIRNNRFNEMEYSVPRESGAECLREVLATIEEKKIDVVFPLEYRYVKGDDLWLSMSTGDEDHAAISIHRTAAADYQTYFNTIEPIFWKYEGRPHWGKLHSLGRSELTRLYPRFEEFLAVRKELDPQGRLLNDHLRFLFGEMGSG